MSMKDYPTVVELLNAGAEHDGCTLYLLKNKDSRFELYLNKAADSFRVYYEEKLLVQNKYPTKDELKTAVKILWGEDLDFEPKEKRYDWEAVKKAIEKTELQHVCLMLSYIHERRVIIGDRLADKLTAILQLDYIVKEISKDFPSGGIGTFGVYWNSANQELRYVRLDFSSDKYFCPLLCSMDGIDTLIKYNEDLIKQALEWENNTCLCDGKCNNTCK